MDMNVRFITLNSTVSTLNSEGTRDSFQANSDYKITGGSLVIFDNAGAVLPSTQHDEITIDLTLDDTNFNPRNLTLSAFALKDVLMREVFPDLNLETGRTIYMKAKHTTPNSGTPNDAVPIRVQLLFSAVKVNG